MASDTHIRPEPTTSTSTSDGGESLRLGYEPRDASLRAIIVFMVVMAVSAAAIHGLVWGLMKKLNHQNENADATPSPFAATEPREHPNPPPEPRLQPSVTHDHQPMKDMEDLRDKWHQALTTYGRVEGQPRRAGI